MTNYFRPGYTPKWFHLENYEPLKDMNRKEIFAIIGGLSSCYRDLPNGTEITIPGEGDEPDEIFIAYPSGFLENLEKGEPIKAPARVEFIPDSSVMPYTMGNYFDIRDRIKEDRNEYYANKGFRGFDELVPTGAFMLPAITVQLRHDDKKILNDFAEWLNAQRKTKRNGFVSDNNRKYLSDKGFQKLIRDRLIPCMHILCWGMSKGIHYPDAELRAMIFPDGLCSSDRQMARYRNAALDYLESTKQPFNII